MNTVAETLIVTAGYKTKTSDRKTSTLFQHKTDLIDFLKTKLIGFLKTKLIDFLRAMIDFWETCKWG